MKAISKDALLIHFSVEVMDSTIKENIRNNLKVECYHASVVGTER